MFCKPEIFFILLTITFYSMSHTIPNILQMRKSRYREIKHADCSGRAGLSVQPGCFQTAFILPINTVLNYVGNKPRIFLLFEPNSDQMIALTNMRVKELCQKLFRDVNVFLREKSKSNLSQNKCNILQCLLKILIFIH